MRKIIEFLFDGCWHRWRAMEKIKLVKNERDEIGHGTRYIYQCEKCHKVKKKDLV